MDPDSGAISPLRLIKSDGAQPPNIPADFRVPFEIGKPRPDQEKDFPVASSKLMILGFPLCRLEAHLAESARRLRNAPP